MEELKFKKLHRSLGDWLGVERGPIALVFTDIVESTDLAITLGDREWVRMLIEHFKKARSYIDKHDGYEVKLIGDSCMAAFRTADKALDFAMDFSIDTGALEISIRAGIQVGDVRVVENDVYGIMVNYTARVQHAMNDAGIALSTAAKQRIEHEHGSKIRGQFDIIPLDHEPLKGFPADQQELWQISTPVKTKTALPETIRFDEYGNIGSSDEFARLDNFAIQLQNLPGTIGYIRAFAPKPGEAARRANRAMRYLVKTRDIDPSALEVIDGGVRDQIMVQLFIGRSGPS